MRRGGRVRKVHAPTWFAWSNDVTLLPVGDDVIVRRLYRYRSSDRVLALLGIYGPMTVAVLAEHLTQSRAQVNSQLQRLRKRGQVELIERRTYIIGFGPRSGRWKVIHDPSPDGFRII